MGCFCVKESFHPLRLELSSMTSRVFPVAIWPLFGRGPIAGLRGIARQPQRACLAPHKAFRAIPERRRGMASRFYPASSQGMTSNIPPNAEGPCWKAPLRHRDSRQNADHSEPLAPQLGSPLPDRPAYSGERKKGGRQNKVLDFLVS